MIGPSEPQSHSSRRRLRCVAGVAVAFALGAAACGDEEREIAVTGAPHDVGGETAVAEGSGDGAPKELTITADNIAFDIGRIEATTGQELTITFDNRDDGIPHNFHVDDERLDVETDITPGPDTQTLDVTVEEPGTYTFICDVHPTQMTGEIVAS